MKKRILVSILCVALCLAMLPFGVLAEETETHDEDISMEICLQESAYTFTTIYDETISSTPESPAELNVIVFGRPTCFNTQSALKSIANSSWSEDSRFHFIYADIDGNDKETVTSFAEKYSEVIDFCYGNNNQVAWNLSKASGTVTLPFIVYIDSSGEVLNATTGYQDGDDIYNNICEALGIEAEPEPEPEPEDPDSGYNMTTIDDETISTTPESPAELNVIVFGRPGCGNTQAALRGISSSTWNEDSNINFIYADVDGNDKDTVTEFSKNYSYNITFCYGDNNSAAWDLSQASGSVTLPFIIYIDTAGDVVQVTTGPQSANDIYDNICEILGYEKIPREFPMQAQGFVLADEARTMLDMINDFRTGSEAWYWDKNNSNQIYCNGLEELVYDYDLERAAIQRAAELAVYYSHTRPDGTSCSTVYPPNGYSSTGENIAMGYGSATDVFEAWREDDEDYYGQGHRRNILYSGFNAVGLACFEADGYKFWVQEFGYADSFSSSQTTLVSYSEDEEQCYDIVASDSVITLDKDDLYTIDEIVLDKGKSKQFELRIITTGYLWNEVYLPADLEVADPSIVTVSEDGTVTGLKAGTTTITATAKYNGTQTCSLSIPVTVKTSLKSATVSDIEDAYYTGKEIEPHPVVMLGKTKLVEGKDYYLEYEDNTEIGTATVKIIGTGIYKGNTSKTFNIVLKTIPVTGVKLDKTTLSLVTGGSATLKTTVSPSNATNKDLSWKSGNKEIATVNKNGKISALKAGTATITVTTVDGKKTAKCKVTVVEKTIELKNIKLNKNTLSMSTSSDSDMSKITLTATFTPSNATNQELTWSSSNPAVATVDNNGNVTALTYGKTTITATSKANSKIKATCDIQTRYYDVMGSSVKGEDGYKYWFAPVYWAADKSITKGYDNVYFAPEENCTREQMITFLWRLKGSPKPKTTKNPFKDVVKGKYYYNAVLWGYENGITKGYSSGPDKGKFGVGFNVTREDTVTFIYRLAGKPKVASADLGKYTFKDIKKNAYYQKPVAWAAKNGITNGYSSGKNAGKFGVGFDVLRKDIVTFLYRYAK